MSASAHAVTKTVNFGDTLALINQSMAKLGDLPIFSSTVNRVQVATSADDSDAMALALEVMKDASLTTRLLKLANSTFYNRGHGKISSVSRAVITLGFNTVKNMCLTLKLIESFQHDHPGTDLEQALVNAYLNAVFVGELATKSGMSDSEDAYICGLLHALGEIIVAYTLPDHYEAMLSELREGKQSWLTVQKDTLGGTFADIGQRLARSWDFPDAVVDTMRPFSHSRAKLTRKQDVHHALAALSHQALLYIRHPDRAGSDSFEQIMNSLCSVAAISRDKVDESLVNSFNRSRELAKNYGLDKDLLSVEASTSSEPALRKLLGRLSNVNASGARGVINEPDDNPAAETDHKTPTSDSAPQPPHDTEAHHGSAESMAPAPTPTDPVTPIGGGNASKQLRALQEITALITEDAGIHRVFAKVAEGLHEGTGLDRVVLCLLSVDQSQLLARLVLGENPEPLKQYFNIPLADRQNLFIEVLRQGEEMRVQAEAESPMHRRVPAAFHDTVGCREFMIAPLRANTRLVGLFYADNGITQVAINDEAHRSFLQFIGQAKLALHYFEVSRNRKH